MMPCRPVGLRRLAPGVAVAVLLPALLSGCEVEAVELVREIEAARGECTRDGLRASDEECVRMMERYTSMGTDLVHTYLGGLRTLDMALDRMPPPGFDTSGVGYAISPGLRQGDAAGIGGSPRLAPARAAGRMAYSDRGPGRDARGRYDEVRYDRWRAGDRRGAARPGWYGRDDDRDYQRGWDGGFESYAPFGLGWLAPFGGGRYTPFGNGPPYGPAGIAPNDPYDRSYPYGYDGYGLRGGYAPRAGWGGGGYGPYGRYQGYDPYAPPYADGGYGRYAPPGPADLYDDVPPADDWGYDPAAADATRPAYPEELEDAYPADDAPAERTATPARPAPHRPGILLPPEERLRRPWLND